MVIPSKCLPLRYKPLIGAWRVRLDVLPLEGEVLLVGGRQAVSDWDARRGDGHECGGGGGGLAAEAGGGEGLRGEEGVAAEGLLLLLVVGAGCDADWKEGGNR